MLADYTPEVYDGTVRACYEVTFASLGLEAIELDEGNTIDICLKNRNEGGSYLSHYYVSNGHESTYSTLEGQDYVFRTDYSSCNEYDTNDNYGCFPFFLYTLR
jgi:hypothetical protein